MKIIKSGDHEIKVFSSAREMPIGRYSDFQKYLSSRTGIDGLNITLNKAKAYLQEGKLEDSEIEINNAITGVLSLQSGVDVLSYGFAIMVVEIDGKMANDTTIEGLNSTLEKLRDIQITQQDLEDSVIDLKKKISEEIESLFPDFIDNTQIMLYFSRVKRYILLACSTYEGMEITDEERLELRSLKNWFLTKDKASKSDYSGIEIERNFISLLSLLEMDMNVTVVQFYGKLDYLNKKNKKEIEHAL